MPHNPELYPFIVWGDGIVATDMLSDIIKLTGKRLKPVSMYFFAKDIETARETAEQIKGFNETVLIAKIEEVVK